MILQFLLIMLLPGVAQVSDFEGSANALSISEQGTPDNGSPEEIFLADYSRYRPEVRLRRRACGPLSLFLLLRLMGVTVPSADIAMEADRADQAGTTFRDLKELAGQYGVSARGVECTLETLRQIGLYGILESKQDHFVALTGFSEEGAQIVSFPMSPGLLPFHTKEPEKTYRVLLLATSPDALSFEASEPARPTSHEPPAAVRLSQTEFNLGVIHDVWEGTSTLTNVSDRPVHIKAVKTSCTCVDAQVTPLKIEPGGTAEVAIKLDHSIDEQSFRYAVYIETDLPRDPLAVTMHGYFGTTVRITPSIVTIRNMAPGASETRELRIIGGDNLPKDMTVEVPADAPLSVNIERAGPDAPPVLRLGWLGAQEPGWYRHKVWLLDRSGGQRLSSAVYVGVHVID